VVRILANGLGSQSAIPNVDGVAAIPVFAVDFDQLILYSNPCRM
jgi:hypothetical protein